MNGHSPGPWTIVPRNPQTAAMVPMIRSNGGMVAAMFGDQRMDANARLIAAAPALLEALQRIVDEGDYTAPEGMKKIAREAIAKASPSPAGEKQA